VYFFIFSCKKKEWLIIEVITLLDHLQQGAVYLDPII
jgi:hypothetical protein